MSSFDVGDKVVYPHHGAAVIERREKKEAFGEAREYLLEERLERGPISKDEAYRLLDEWAKSRGVGS
jgi:hypothetical protein